MLQNFQTNQIGYNFYGLKSVTSFFFTNFGDLKIMSINFGEVM